MTTEATTLMNRPVDITIAGKALKVKTIGFLRRLALAEDCYRSRLIRDIRAKAEAFDDLETRGRYVRDELDKIPSGQDLTRVAMKSIPDETMLNRLLTECVVEPAVTEDCVALLLRDATNDEVRAFMVAALGVSPLKKAPASTPARQKKS